MSKVTVRYFIIIMLMFSLVSGSTGCALLDVADTDFVSGYGNQSAASSSNKKNSSSLAGKTAGSRKTTTSAKNKTATVLVYMNGSDLESDDGAASRDIGEMIKGCKAGNVNVIVQTMGTKRWSKKYGIASDRSQIYKVDANGLTLVNDNLGQLDCTESETLSDFISWGVKNYPADRYFLQLWDHGAGAVYGFGYDQYADEESTLNTAEIKEALSAAGVHFDFIGMDCCIMANLETCCMLSDFCDYTILSEDFEPGDGWFYSGWLEKLNNDTSINTKKLAKAAIDDMVGAIEAAGESRGILTVFDESVMKVLFTAWKDFAYANEAALLENNYSRQVKAHGRVHPILSKGADKPGSLSDYYVTDIMALAQTLNTSESKALESAVNNAIVYSNCTSDVSNLTGLAVTLPYGDSYFYRELEPVFTDGGVDKDYVKWLSNFVGADGASDYYDYDDWDESWDGWGDYTDDYDWSDWEHYDEFDDFWQDDGGFFDDYDDDYYDYYDYYDDYGYDDYDYYGDYDDYDYYDYDDYYEDDYYDGYDDDYYDDYYY